MIKINHLKERDNNLNAANIKVVKVTIVRENKISYIKNNVQG